jgi:hypothetical protein
MQRTNQILYCSSPLLALLAWCHKNHRHGGAKRNEQADEKQTEGNKDNKEFIKIYVLPIRQ